MDERRVLSLKLEAKQDGAHAAQNPLVVIVDDDASVRDALCELLLSVDIDAISFASTKELLDANLPDRPGCLILDVRMPGSSGLDLQRKLANSDRAMPIIFLTGHGDIPMTVEAMKAGAIDFLTKPVRDQTLLDAIAKAIAADKTRQTEGAATRRALALLATLTPREMQILRSVVVGKLNKQIAFDLGISEITVKIHRGNLMKKMHATSVAHLVSGWQALPADIRHAGPS